MDYTKEENYTFARRFLKEGDIDNYGGHYYMLLQKDPENAEAQFFSAYYGYHSLMSESDYPSALNAFHEMTKWLEAAVECVKNSGCEENEKLMVLSGIVEIYTPLTRHLFIGRISTAVSTIEGGVLGLYALGSAIKNNFGSNPEALKLAIKPWMEAVSLQNSFYAYKYNGAKLEDYINEIKKIDPTYVAPKVPTMKKIIDKIKGIFKR